MAALLSWLGQRYRASLALGFLVAIMLPALAEILRPFLPAAVAGLLVMATLRTDPRALRRHVQRPWIVILVSLAMLLLAPALVYLCARPLGLPPALLAALVLSAGLPPLFSVPAMAMVLELDVALALSLVVLGTVLAPFTLVPVAAILLEMDLAVSPLQLMLRLAALVLGAMALGVILRQWLSAARVEAMHPVLSGVVVVLMLLFAVAIMDGVPAAFHRQPAQVALFVAAAIALNAGLQLLGVLCALGLGRRASLTVGFASGNRSLGLLLAVLPASADPWLALFFALGQFPIYLLPLALGPLYRRLLGGRRAVARDEGISPET